MRSSGLLLCTELIGLANAINLNIDLLNNNGAEQTKEMQKRILVPLTEPSVSDIINSAVLGCHAMLDKTQEALAGTEADANFQYIFGFPLPGDAGQNAKELVSTLLRTVDAGVCSGQNTAPIYVFANLADFINSADPSSTIPIPSCEADTLFFVDETESTIVLCDDFYEAPLMPYDCWVRKMSSLCSGLEITNDRYRKPPRQHP